MSGGWGCPHEFQGRCQRVNNIPCDPGMKGCVLFGRFVFSNPSKNRPGGPCKQRQGGEAQGSEGLPKRKPSEP